MIASITDNNIDTDPTTDIIFIEMQIKHLRNILMMTLEHTLTEGKQHIHTLFTFLYKIFNSEA